MLMLMLRIDFFKERWREENMVSSIYRPYKKEVIRTIFPPILAILLFIVTLFAVALPVFKQNLLIQKKALIAAEVQTVLSMLKYYQQLVSSGTISLELGRKMAIEQVRKIRYGFEGKGYFWINDTKSVMVMHPRLKKIEGKDFTHFIDSEGRHLFQAKRDSGTVGFWNRQDRLLRWFSHADQGGLADVHNGTGKGNLYACF
ncbi:MAG: hypothetical protein D3913_11395 [Candidatus Electrothrix sp. LOE1_4_5]|nr:hypothetical protein [Candidatus Electrothrix gigas]